MNTPNWTDVLPAPPPQGRLQEAWMTTFERPDPSLLVEHLLPSLLGVNSSLSPEVKDRNLFFGELDIALEVLRGRITVVSSPPREEHETSEYPWLWRYVGHFTVGAVSSAVQHAKLWAFHWKGDNEEFIELNVSSTNLTMSAFKAQVQAGWRILLPLKARPTASALKSWGDLIAFLEALGAAAGSVANQRFGRLVALLSRVECPADTVFIASIPGAKSAGRQLRRFEASEMHVLAPTVGEWNGRTLSAWSKDLEIPLNKIRLKWISTTHPWAANDGWTLSTNVNAALDANGVRVERIPDDVQLTEEHLSGDKRWSHAKLYLLRTRQKRRLLVTSANWSPSAWGAGNLSPQNFELGVAFETKWKDLESVDELFDPPDTIPFCVDREEPEERTSPLEWAEASWDGTKIELCVRSSDKSTSISSTVCFSDGSEKEVRIIDDTGAMPWQDPDRTPVSARFVQGTESLNADILDLRPPAEFAKTPLPQVDRDIAEALREAFLLQRYGGPAVDPETIPGLSGKPQSPAVATPASDYSVQTWTDARAAFEVVDRWQIVFEDASGDPALRECVRSDGEELQAIYSRRDGPAARLAAEELRWRLDGGA